MPAEGEGGGVTRPINGDHIVGPGAEACPACGSDRNEKDELVKSEREIDRLLSELGPLGSAAVARQS